MTLNEFWEFNRSILNSGFVLYEIVEDEETVSTVITPVEHDWENDPAYLNAVVVDVTAMEDRGYEGDCYIAVVVLRKD